jgi:hypothetical protein
MYPVADDFAAIAQRLKEIQAEVAEERAVVDARTQTEDERQPESRYMYDDTNRGRDARCRAPPAQIPASPIRALGSYLGWVTAKRTSGQG